MHEHPVTWGERAWVGLLRLAPLRTYGHLVRAVSWLPLPTRLRAPVFGSIAGRIGIDLAEAEYRVGDYRRFADLFVRRLRHGRRPIAAGANVVLCPTDGVVTAVGEATKEGLIQAKGIRYSLEDLVQDPALAAELDGGTSLTIYLRPRDYHRIHSPVQGRLRSLRHIPGTVFPVKPYMVRNLKGLFTRNERVVLEIETQWGRVVMVCVAAAGVGNISTVFTGGRCRTSLTDLDVAVGKGEEIAAFKLGSTVILVFPPGKVALGEVQPGQEVRVGQAVAQFVRRAPDGDKH